MVNERKHLSNQMSAMFILWKAKWCSPFRLILFYSYILFYMPFVTYSDFLNATFHTVLPVYCIANTIERIHLFTAHAVTVSFTLRLSQYSICCSSIEMNNDLP